MLLIIFIVDIYSDPVRISILFGKEQRGWDLMMKTNFIYNQ